MDWYQTIDGYCERLDPGYWAEPVNALTNLCFVIAALVMAWRLRGTSLPLGWAMTVILAMIGLGSYLFHTHAQGWSALTDTGSIAAFILIYLYAASRDFLGLSPLLASVCVVGFFPFAATMTPVFSMLPVVNVSAGYLPVALLIAIYGLILRKKAPETARGLLVGAAILLVSIVLRSLDMPLCGAFPVGTHFLWHILNATMLGWMIEVYRCHMLAPPSHGR